MRRKRRRDVDEHDKSAAERHDGDDDTDRCGVVASSSQHAADTAPPPPQVATVTSTTCSFGQYVWSDIGIIWYARLALLVHDACARCARAARRRHAQQQRQQQQDDDSDSDNSDDDSDAAAVLTGLACDMHVAWQAARVHFADAAERHGHDARVSAYTTRLLAALRDVAATHTDNDDSADADELTLCRRLLRVLEQHGLAEADCVGGMCSSSSTTTRWRRSYSSALLRRLHELRQRRASRVGYAYSKRTSMILTPPCGLDVGRRDDDNNNSNNSNSKSNSKSAGAATAATVTQPPSSRPRAGYVVQLPLPHPHREVNTAVQLLEPRRRRTALDEYRVVAHPKKAAAFAADDCIIEEELLHRAYVVLCHHVDVYGSLRDVSPYTRVTLWRLLDQDTATLLRLCLADATATATAATAVTAAVNGKDAAMRTRAAKREVVVAADSNNNNNSNGHEEGNNKQDVGDDTNSSDNTGKTTAVAVTCGNGDDDDMHVADAALRLCRLRSLLQRKLAALEAARPACRRTAQCIAWAAASAQWRDAALAAMDAHDWYALRDTLRMSTTTSRYTLSTSSGGNSGRDGGGGNIVAVIVNNNNNSNSSSSSSGSSSGGGGVAIFPNYARAPAVRALALALLRKLDEHYDTATTTTSVTQQQSGDGARRRSRSSTAASLSASREGSAATTSTSTTATTAAARRRRRQTRTAAAAASSSSSSATEARPGSVHEMVLRVLLPLLMGEVPTLTTSCVTLHADELSTAAHTSMTTTTATEEDSSSNNNNTTQQAPPPSSSWRRQQARLHAFFDGRHVSVQRYARHLARTTTTAAVTSDNDDDDSDDDDGGGGCVYSFVCPSVVLALQSVAELLELCSLAHYSAIGMTAFARRLRSASWHDERTLLTFVSRREPANVALATMAGGVLRVYAELSAAVRQLATRERLLAAVVLARRLAAHSSLVDVRRRDRCYVYGTALASVFADDGRSDELYMLRVQCSRPPSQQQQQQRQRRRQRRRPGRSARGNGSGKDDDDDSDDSDDDTDDDDEEEDERERWCNEAALERAPAVWPEELRELMDDEARYRATHTSHDVSSS